MNKGDYVRTKNLGGSIEKVIDIKEDILTKEKKKYYATDISALYSVRITDEDIIKSSPNIIDLIEVGDLVRIETEKDDTNIFEVVAINYNDGEIGVFNNNFEFDWASIEQLKSIVTKEQFESMEYKIGE